MRTLTPRSFPRLFRFLTPHGFVRQRRGLRTLLLGISRLDGATVGLLVLQWIATMFVAMTLLESSAITHRLTRMVVLLSAGICGPVTCAGLLRSMHKIRRRRFQQEQLLHCARHDELTGLPNRAALQTFLADLLRSSAGDSGGVTCFYLDVDGLRHANTLLGYRAGDELLQRIVARAANCLNPADHFSRFGGDKFVILVHRSLSRSELNALAECLIYTVSRPLRLDGREFTAGVSIGIAHSPANATTPDTLIAAAERAMYAVKLAGRHSYRHADQSDEPADARHRVLADKLQRALVSGDLRLVYQPIFDREGCIVAAEALARWHDPEEGHISPAEFIPVAEETGLIVPLSVWVLGRACLQMQSWRKVGAAIRRIAVNICVLQVSREDFVSTIETVLRDTGLPAESLELEVTEGALARDFAAVKEHLQRLRNLGVRISIDDFGTGYSSFGRLRELNADALKIDRVFVQGAHDTHNGVAVLQALIEMAHTLNLSVVAEGVETVEQMNMLRALNCNEMQGFLLARPQEPEFLDRLLLAPQAGDGSDSRAMPSSGNLIPGFA